MTSPKIRHQNDVTKVFCFQATPLVKAWLRLWRQALKSIRVVENFLATTMFVVIIADSVAFPMFYRFVSQQQPQCFDSRQQYNAAANSM